MSRTAWLDPRVDGNGSWKPSQPHPELRLTVFGAFVAAAVLTLLFCGAVAFGQKVMCATHRIDGRGALTYCSDYRPVQP